METAKVEVSKNRLFFCFIRVYPCYPWLKCFDNYKMVNGVEWYVFAHFGVQEHGIPQ
jgi:hypothetical protein